jgi:signal transduction histidine kinase
LQSLLDAVSEGLLIVGSSGKIIAANFAATNMLGGNVSAANGPLSAESLRLFERDGITPFRVSEFMFKSDDPLRMIELLAGGPGHSEEKRLSAVSRPLYANDGSVQASAVLLRESGGEPDRCSGSYREWLQQVLDRMPVGVLLVERDTGRLIFANRAADRMAGGKFPPVWMDDSENLIPSDQSPVTMAARGERLEEIPATWSTPAGLRHLLVYTDGLPAADGEASLGIIVCQDVGPAKAAEAEVRKKQDDLMRLNEDLQQFIYAASHDLQEPLRMVSGYTQLIARRYQGKLDAEADEYIQFAVDGAERMSQLIKDLLAYSRAGNLETRRLEQVDMGSVVQWALLNLHAAIKEHGAVVTHEPLPTITGDQARLARVMQNLIGNAIQYRSAEPPRIHISASLNGESWVFCVADNGCGFEMQYAERIFGVFKRLHGKDIPGTGIGLAIAKKIIEIHNGRIWAESEPGQGSRFYFTIPTD